MYSLKKTVSALLGVVICCSALANEPGTSMAKMVLVMDDIGYNLPRGKRAAELPGAITYAIIPHTPLAKKIAFYAVNRGDQKEIIVHMPMQARSNRKIEEGALTQNLSREDFVSRLRSGLSNVPFAVGLSNHMGSALTQMEEPMQWLMSELQLHGYFFLDSRTATSNTAHSAAHELSVPYLKRDIFLDHDTSVEAITRAFERAKALAKQRGMAVVLAHPYPETLAFLEQNLPVLASQGIELVTASEAIKININQARSSTAAIAANIAPANQ